jgi:hypothetical protein
MLEMKAIGEILCMHFFEPHKRLDFLISINYNGLK